MYCEDPSSVERKSCRTVMDILFKSLTTWLAPIICFTAEEAWQCRYKDSENSVHLQTYFKGDKDWKNDKLGQKWSDIRELRSVVTTSIEEKRKEGILGSSLQAKILIEANEESFKVLQDVNLPEIFICSDVQIDLNQNLSETKIMVNVKLASGGKCMRCWKIVPEVKNNIELCNRCTKVLKFN